MDRVDSKADPVILDYGPRPSWWERLSRDMGMRVFGLFEFLGTLIGIAIDAVGGLRPVFLAIGLYLVFYGWTRQVAIGLGASLIGLAIPLPRRGR